MWSMIIDVIDLKFDKLNFIRHYDPERLARGRIVYRSQSAAVTKVEKIDKTNYVIEAKVEGTYEREYDVKLKINDNYIRECSCTCEDFYNGNLCKHILATSMEVIEPHNASTAEGTARLRQREKEEEEERRRLVLKQIEDERKEKRYRERYSNALNAINTFKKNTEMNNLDIPIERSNLRELYNEIKEEKASKMANMTELATDIRIEPRLQVRYEDMQVSFKIGQTKMYILKDIGEFCEALLEERELQYGKNLRFICKKENFDKDSQRLLDFILDYGRLVKLAGEMSEDNYYRYSRRTTISYKELNIVYEKIDEFFDVIKNNKIAVSGYRIDDNEFEVTDEDLDIKIEARKASDNKDYELEINIEDYYYISGIENIYVFYENKIYKFGKKENKNLEDILLLFKYDKCILIPDNKIKEFEKYVFSEIRNYLHTENLPAEIVKEAIIPSKLASKVYLDLDEKDNIILELKFCYLDKEFNILDPDYKKYIEENAIVRDVLGEKEVLKRLFFDGFELTNNKKYFTLKDEDETYEFLSVKVSEYMNDFEVLITDKFKTKKITNTRISNVSVKLDGGLLELDISKIDIDINEIKDVLKNYNLKKKYYKLKNGDFLNLENSEDLEFLNDIQNSFDISYDKLNNGKIKLPVNRGVYLEKLLEQNHNISASKNDDFTKLVNNIENKNFSEDFKIPENFEKVLRDYQKTGYKWLKVLEYYKFGGILADDMGLGKTLQVISLIASGLKEDSGKTSIVVCPSSLVLNWKAEVEKWCKDIRVLIIKGDLKTRQELISKISDYDLVITSYDLLKRDVSEYDGKVFKYVIADEAQYIKNFTTQNATALKSIEGEIKFALTGTPIENSVSELWSIFDFIMPGYLYSYNKFKRKFETPILKDNDDAAMRKLKLLINPFVLRRVKSDVLTELPEKNVTIMNNEMTSEQEKIYLSYFAQTKKEVAEELSANGFEKSKFRILMLLTRLRQICCHPSLFIDNYTGGSGKLTQCMDIVNDAISSGHKILLFSGYTSMFELIEQELKKENIEYYKLTGSTPVDKRVEMVERFNKDENVKIFLISLKAGGTGLNLTGADVVIHYDPWWNVSSENQATDRAYRIGQKNSVQVYKLITTNSIEEKINKLQEKKAKLSSSLLSTEETFINKFSKEEIMELFE